MGVSKANTTDWKRRLVREIQRDAKRTAVLGVLAVVAVVMVARAVLTRTPKSAKAAARAAARTAPPNSQPDAAGGWTPAARREDKARREEYLANMNRRISRDLFRPNLEYFPLAGGTGAVAIARAPAGPGWFDEVRDFAAEKDRSRQAERIRRSTVRSEAGSLSLTSTMMGNSPIAVINGRLLRPGEKINGFRLVGISRRMCTLTKEGVTVELYMKAP